MTKDEEEAFLTQCLADMRDSIARSSYSPAAKEILTAIADNLPGSLEYFPQARRAAASRRSTTPHRDRRGRFTSSRKGARHGRY